MPARRSCGPTARAAWIRTAILVLLFLGPRQAPAHSFIPKAFDDLVAEADHIFQGAVTGKQSRTLQSGIIVTDVAFSIILELKGHAADPVTLVVLGGTVGEERVDVAGFPELAVGREYLLFVKDNGTTILPFVGGDQGLFEIHADTVGGQKRVMGTNGKAVSSSVRAAVRPATAGAPVQLEQMMTAVRERLRAR